MLLGFKEEARNFKYRAVLSDGMVNGDERTFFGQVRSMDENSNDIVKNQNAFVIGRPTCENFRGVDNSIPYIIEVRNLKEEAKDDDEESGISDDNIYD